MANQMAVGVHTRPGDELLCASTAHVYVWEAGGVARHSGVTARTFEGDHGNSDGPVEFRSYRIIDGEVNEEPVEVVDTTLRSETLQSEPRHKTA